MHSFISYRPDLKLKARNNRNNPTKSEAKMWYEVLANRKMGHKFIRQKPIHNFIVDFYSPELKMAIEIDGDTHVEQIEYDLQRTQIMKELNIQIVRYKNSDIKQKIEGVSIDLKQKIKQREDEIDL